MDVKRFLSEAPIRFVTPKAIGLKAVYFPYDATRAREEITTSF
jgi:hypothetical protein